MRKPRLLIFSNNLAPFSQSTVGHVYQTFLDEISLLATTFCYGPGYPEFCPTDSLKDVISKASFEPDCLFFAHHWLIDTEGETAVDPLPTLDLKNTTYPKVLMLNKEYVNLKNKLNYIKVNNFDLVFTHHHHTELFAEQSKTPTIFLPLGYNHRVFSLGEYDVKTKDIDLLFSGILQNSNPGVQSDLRYQIMQTLFYCLGDIPLRKKPLVRPLNIVWNGQPRSRLQNSVAQFIGSRRVLPIDEYVSIQKRSKITLNALSPYGLISSRHMESMALKSLVLAEKSDLYANIFPDNLIVTYSSDRLDFVDKLHHYLYSSEDRLRITEQAYNHVIANHTWEHRAQTIVKCLKQLDSNRLEF